MSSNDALKAEKSQIKRKIFLHFAKNWQENFATFQKISNSDSNNICFKEIDWFDHENIFITKNADPNNNKYELSLTDLNCLTEASVLLAADVIYDDKITLALMNTIYKLMTSSPVAKTCIIANEQRINFNTEFLTVADTAYDYFEKCLDELNEYVDTESGYRFEIEHVEMDNDSFPKYVVNYNRNNYLNIWIIRSFPL